MSIIAKLFGQDKYLEQSVEKDHSFLVMEKKSEVMKKKKRIEKLLFPYDDIKYCVEKYPEANKIFVSIFNPRSSENYFVTRIVASLDGAPLEKEINQDDLLRGGPYTKKISYDLAMYDWHYTIYFNKGKNLGILQETHGGMGGCSSRLTNDTWRVEDIAFEKILPSLKIAEAELGRRLIDDQKFIVFQDDYKYIPKDSYTTKYPEDK